MIDRDHELSVTSQAEAVGIARSTVYYLPRPASAVGRECCAVYWLPMGARSDGVT